MHSRQNRINGIIRYPKSFGSFFAYIRADKIPSPDRYVKNMPTNVIKSAVYPLYRQIKTAENRTQKLIAYYIPFYPYCQVSL